MKTAQLAIITVFLLLYLPKANALSGAQVTVSHLATGHLASEQKNNALEYQNNRAYAVKRDKPALKVKSRKQATAMVKSRYNAKVLSVQSATVNGNPGYKAKLLSSDGVVFFVYIDSVSGRMSRG